MNILNVIILLISFPIRFMFILSNIISRKIVIPQIRLIEMVDLPRILINEFSLSTIELEDNGFEVYNYYKIENVDEIKYICLLYNDETKVLGTINIFIDTYGFITKQVVFSSKVNDGSYIYCNNAIPNIYSKESDDIFLKNYSANIVEQYEYHLEFLRENDYFELVSMEDRLDDFLSKDLDKAFQFQNRRFYYKDEDGYKWKLWSAFMLSLELTFNFKLDQYFKETMIKIDLDSINKDEKVDLLAELYDLKFKIDQNKRKSFIFQIFFYFLITSFISIVFYFINDWITAIYIFLSFIILDTGRVIMLLFLGQSFKNINLLGILNNEFALRDKEKVLIHLAGPTLGIGVGLFLYYFTPYLYPLAVTILIMSYFNLLPILPFDGGKIIGTIFTGKFKNIFITIFSILFLGLIALKLKSIVFTVITIVLIYEAITKNSKTVDKEIVFRCLSSDYTDKIKGYLDVLVKYDDESSIHKIFTKLNYIVNYQNNQSLSTGFKVTIFITYALIWVILVIIFLVPLLVQFVYNYLI